MIWDFRNLCACELQVSTRRQIGWKKSSNSRSSRSLRGKLVNEPQPENPFMKNTISREKQLLGFD